MRKTQEVGGGGTQTPQGGPKGALTLTGSPTCSCFRSNSSTLLSTGSGSLTLRGSCSLPGSPTLTSPPRSHAWRAGCKPSTGGQSAIRYSPPPPFFFLEKASLSKGQEAGLCCSCACVRFLPRKTVGLWPTHLGSASSERRMRPSRWARWWWSLTWWNWP